ncbi:MAG: hypothetical protein ACI4R8_02920 [Candidatus Caccovivens sp.]
MEIAEIENEITENQISFDFLNELQPTVEVSVEDNHDWVANETLVVIVKAKGEISPNFDLCGKKLVDWVSLATSGCKQVFIDEPEGDILSAVRDLGEGYAYIAVLYSDTPLLKKSTFFDIMDYFSKHRMNVMCLKRGYVFKAEYLKTAKIMLSSAVHEFDGEDFTIIDNAQKLSYAFKILNKRILDYHKKNGVIFFGENTIFVDADVEIEAGTVVYPNNILKGESYIGKNVILESGNYIFDTIICDEAFVCQSYLEKSKIEKGKVVGPFERIINQKV